MFLPMGMRSTLYNKIAQTFEYLDEKKNMRKRIIMETMCRITYSVRSSSFHYNKSCR